MDDEYNTRELLQAFQIAAEESGSIVFVFDFAAQSITVTKATALAFGVATEQKGVPYEIAKRNIVAEDSKDEYIRLHEAMMNGAERVHGRVRLRNAAGEMHYYNLIFRALFHPDGTPTGKAVGIYRNITETRKMFLHQFALTKALSEGVASVYYVDLDSDVFTVEQLSSKLRDEVSSYVKQEKNANRSFSAVTGKYCELFVHEDDYDCVKRELDPATMKKKLQKQHTYFIQYRVKPNPLNQRYFEVHVTGADENTRRHRAFISFRCIDKQKKRELHIRKALEDAYLAATQANKAKSNFLSRMSHDLRTPLNAIIGMTALAGEYTGDPERVKNCLEKIMLSGKYLLGLINNVLDLSKIESGMIELNITSFNIKKLINDLLTMTKPSLDDKRHEISIDFHDIEHEYVQGDPRRIMQAFMNFMSNAVKYTPPGGHIGLAVRELPTGSEDLARYEFVFEDDGIGMSEEFQKHIFEPFSRVEKNQGSGLGMAIAQNIIQLMNGNVRAESEPGKGSRFIITMSLPLAERPSPDSGNSAPPEAENETSGEASVSLERIKRERFDNKRVLLAEDNELNAEIASEILSMTGLALERAHNGKEAVDMLEKSPVGYYDLVFMDIQMPVLNGCEATRVIRASRREDLRVIPIVAMSANAFHSDVEASHAAGMDEHISKPINIEQLLHVLHKYLAE